jgi:hypothetical protein
VKLLILTFAVLFERASTINILLCCLPSFPRLRWENAAIDNIGRWRKQLVAVAVVVLGELLTVSSRV